MKMVNMYGSEPYVARLGSSSLPVPTMKKYHIRNWKTRADFATIVQSLARIAQLVEHTTDTGGVPGSNPGARTNNQNEHRHGIIHL